MNWKCLFGHKWNGYSYEKHGETRGVRVLFRLAIVVALSLPALSRVGAQNYTLTDKLPGIIFGYSLEEPVVKDQSQVATVVHPYVSGMVNYEVQAIDGVKIGNGRKSPFSRTGSKGQNVSTYDAAIDLLPGRHTLTINYWEYIWVDEKKRKYVNVNPLKSIDVEMEFEAGCVYQIKALIFNFNFMGLSIDRELTDPTIVERLATTRKNAVLIKKST
jgi:hypothetical protein